MPFTREFIDVLLAADDSYKEEMILDYTEMESHIPTRMYADFVKMNIANTQRPENIQPFELFLLKHKETNAWAWYHNSCYVICIHLSLFKVIENRVKQKLSTLTEGLIPIISKCQFTEKEPADFLVYQFATIFTFYHEFAHLLQFSRSKLTNAHFERYNLVKGQDYDPIAHAMEIDADVFAAEHINAHLFQYWNKLPENKKTKESLEGMISLCILSVFILFFELSKGWREWYTLDYDHPNSLIRVCYIHDVLYQTSKANEDKIGFEINNKVVLDDALTLADHFLENGENSGLESFVRTFSTHSAEIHHYINEVMFPFISSIDYLNYNNRA